ncbi:hypothetical protein COU61_01355 [Candidatus Pacearchaeota archaeon CG10_big_fil_rev_8_21_14_0_10_35_13]|nr:MAG: hypothetical protein COU61_01355 [Candidatus Pacearchaeota archaeon CG10_big_fil_rev_8_21_14_0_10_35_13]
MKKSGKILALTLISMFLLSVIVSFVGAQSFNNPVTPGIGDSLSNAGKIGSGILSWFWGILEKLVGAASGADTGVVKILLFVLLYMIIYVVVDMIPLFKRAGGTGLIVRNIVAIIVAFLSIRFLADDKMINAILLPYGALGIAVTSIIPIIIYVFIIQKSGAPKWLRNTGYLFFFLLFIVLAMVRWDELSYTQGPEIMQSFNLGWVYLVTAVLSIFLMFFDGTFHRWWYANRIERSYSKAVGINLSIEEGQRKKLVDDLAKALDDNERKKIKDQIKIINDNIKELRKETKE